MYESFGAVAEKPKVTFRLFLPDNSRDSNQYSRADDPHIISIRVIGDFQQQIEQTNWDYTSGLTLNKKPHPKGWLWEASIPNLSDGFYEYKYFVQFENGTTRKCSNPCSKYDGSAAEHSAFVIGGNDMVVRSLANRLPIQDWSSTSSCSTTSPLNIGLRVLLSTQYGTSWTTFSISESMQLSSCHGLHGRNVVPAPF